MANKSLSTLYNLEIEKLDAKAMRQITKLLDTFIEHEKLKRKAQQRAA